MGLFDFLFKKEKEVEKPKEEKQLLRKLKLECDLFPFNVGKTQIEVTFDDGKKFITSVYGIYDQYVNVGHDADKKYNAKEAKEPVVQPPNVQNSLKIAQFWIANLSYSETTLVDDPKNPMRSKIGKIVSTRILKTLPFEESYAVYKIVPKSEGEK